MASLIQVLVCAVCSTLIGTTSAQTIRADSRHISAPAVAGRWSHGSDLGSDPDLFPFETTQLTDNALATVKGTGLDPANLTALFGPEKPTLSCGKPGDRPPCKAYPGTPEWPSEAVWKAFDVVLGGAALVKTIPLAAPCFNSWPSVQNNETCSFVKTHWNQFRYHVEDIASVGFPLFEGRTCLPVNAPDGNCTVGGYPAYVVNVTNVAQVQLAVNFARNANLRLVIKNKGHDYNAKSTGGGGLSVNTNHLQDIRYISNYTGGKYEGPALKVGVGAEVGTVYEYADSLNLSVVAGIGRSIGLAGGYSQGGGHAPLSSLFGLGADQILSLEVVLADGTFVTANTEQNSDLYWAVRGGGGSTFGVVTSAIIAVYPGITVATVTYSLTNRSPNTTEAFWTGIREFYQMIVPNADAGQYVIYRLTCNLPTQSWNCTLQLTPHWANNATVAELQSYMAPYFAKLNVLGVPVVNPVWKQHSSVAKAWNSFFGGDGQAGGSVTGNTHSASRIWPRRNFADPALFNASFATTRHVIEAGNGRMLAFNLKMAINPRVSQDNAAHPVWRDTVLFSLMSNGWGVENATDETIAMRSQQLVQQMQPWRDVTPGAGSYLNEGDINEPDFQQAFWGANYPRLYKLKHKYDPTGTFFATTAVGSEDWYITDQVPYYPTTNGRLCRKA